MPVKQYKENILCFQRSGRDRSKKKKKRKKEKKEIYLSISRSYSFLKKWTIK